MTVDRTQIGRVLAAADNMDWTQEINYEPCFFLLADENCFCSMWEGEHDKSYIPCPGHKFVSLSDLLKSFLESNQ